MSKISQVAAIVRSYGNPDIVKQVKRLKNLGIQLIYVITKAKDDRNSTPIWLGKEGLTESSGVRVIQMWEGYHWSTSLNMGICALQLKRLKSASLDGGSYRYVLNCSVEALFEAEHLESMLQKFDDEEVAIVGTSFKAQSKGIDYETGRSYLHPRNTGMLIDLEKFPCGTPLFDPFCDQIGGMEDIDFVFRVLAFSNYKSVMVDSKVPLIVNKYYDQDAKESREQSAMDKIIDRWRQSCTLGTAEYESINTAILEMNLELPN
jgi:hypothetical protein